MTEHKIPNIVQAKCKNNNNTLAAFCALRSRTLFPWATILLFRSASFPDPPDFAAGGGVDWTAEGFHSFPVAALYSAFRVNRSFTAASISPC